MTVGNRGVPTQANEPLILADHNRRIRILEALFNEALCPLPTALSPLLTLSGGSVDPSGYNALQLDHTCVLTAVEGFTFGDLLIQMGANPGTGGASSFYEVSTFQATNPEITQSYGYGFMHQNGGTIAYPAILQTNGIRVLGVNDGGGGTHPTFARPDYPWVWANGDVLFDGHYQTWTLAPD